jgi:hypothetical protein
MDDEHTTAYALAMKYGATRTAALIRANKASIGRAILSACKEIGAYQVTLAIEESRNPWWALCAMRYAPLEWWHRGILSIYLTNDQYRHAAWVLKNFRHEDLSKDELGVLKWLAQLAR